MFVCFFSVYQHQLPNQLNKPHVKAGALLKTQRLRLSSLLNNSQETAQVLGWTMWSCVSLTREKLGPLPCTVSRHLGFLNSVSQGCRLQYVIRSYMMYSHFRSFGVCDVYPVKQSLGCNTNCTVIAVAVAVPHHRQYCKPTTANWSTALA